MTKIFIFKAALISVILTCINLNAEELPVENPWKMRTELSHVRTSGNTDTQTFSGKLEIKRDSLVNRYFFSGKILNVKDRNEEISDKLSLNVRWERSVTKRLFALLTAGYIRDRFSGYDYRVSAGPGMGYSFLDMEKQKLQLLLSSIYYYDKFSTADGDYNEYLTGKTTAKYELQIYENLKFKELLDYFTSFKDSDKYFIESETAVEVKINKSLSLGVSYNLNYQNKLPPSVTNRTDITFLTTLIIDF